MFLSVLRFIGATIVAVVLAYLIDFTAMWLFENIAYVLSSKLPWENHRFLACIIIMVCFPLTPVFILIAVMPICIVANGLFLIIGKKKYIAIFFIPYFIIKIISTFKIFFINSNENITCYIGHGVGYYIGAVITFLLVTCIYNFIIQGMFDNGL